MRSKRRIRASALIVAMGVLTVLALLAFTFSSIARTERIISSNYTDMVRAHLLATSGIEAAVASLRNSAGTKSWDGLVEDWSFGIVAPSTPNSFPPNEPNTTPVENARAPSFCVRTGGPSSPPAALTINGIQVGYSGLLPGTYEATGDSYAVKVVDSASKLNLNGWEPNLPTMLTNLGLAIRRWMQENPALYAPPYFSTQLPAYNPIGSSGAAIVNGRNALPGQQFAMLEEVEPFLPAPPSGVAPQENLALLRSFITVYGWTDPTVLRSNPSAAYGWTAGPINQDISYSLTLPVPGTTDPPAGRPPVNVNTASAPVITAVLTGLKGVALAAGVPTGGGISGGGILSGQFRAVETTAISFNEAYAIAGQIDNYRRTRTIAGKPIPFTNWQQFNAYINGDGDGNGSLDAAGLPASVFPTAEDAMYHRALIQAMANPNADIQKFNPSRALSRAALIGANATAAMDKTDIYESTMTTELCFSSNGYFEIESIGRVTGGGGTLRAARKIRTAVKLFDLVRLTTQRDFLLNKAGGGFQRTVTYPENVRNLTPCSTEDGANPGLGSRLDGQVSLKDRLLDTDQLWQAALDDKIEGTDDYVRPNPYSGLAYKSLHGISLFNPPGTGTLTTVGNEVVYCSDLFADGLFQGASRNRFPSWSYSPTGDNSIPPNPAPGNMQPDNGTIGFWLKPVAGTGGSLAGAASILLLGRDQGVYSGSFFRADIYGVFMTKDWINGGHCSKVSGGYILPNANYRNDLTYPFVRDYFILAYPSWSSSLGMSDWHYVQFSWSNYYTWTVRFDGQQVASATGYIVGPGSYVYLNTTRIIDDMQIASLFLPAYWGGVWKYMTEGTIDNISTYRNATSQVPYRYDPTNGGSSYSGSFPYPPGTPSSARVLSVTFTQLQPGYRANGASIPPADRPYVRITTDVGGTAYDCGSVGDGTDGLGNVLPINVSASTSSPVTFLARFYDQGVTPTNVAPYLDDVSMTYSTGTEFLFWVEGE